MLLMVLEDGLCFIALRTLLGAQTLQFAWTFSGAVPITEHGPPALSQELGVFKSRSV